MLRILAILALLPAGALAESGPRLDFTFGFGAGITPDYPGASGYSLGPSFTVRPHRFQLGRLSLGSDPDALKLGFSPRGSFRIVGDRDSGEYPEIAGLDDIDTAVELGFGIGYHEPGFELFADLRRGFGGHEAVVAEIGGDVIRRPTERLTVSAGPRVLIAEGSYTDTYFGVSGAEAAASGLPAFDADGGVVSAGVEAVATYRLGRDWAVEGGLTYDRLLGDAAESPIVEQGSANQWGLRLGLTKRIRLGF